MAKKKSNKFNCSAPEADEFLCALDAADASNNAEGRIADLDGEVQLLPSGNGRSTKLRGKLSGVKVNHYQTGTFHAQPDGIDRAKFVEQQCEIFVNARRRGQRYETEAAELKTRFSQKFGACGRSRGEGQHVSGARAFSAAVDGRNAAPQVVMPPQLDRSNSMLFSSGLGGSAAFQAGGSSSSSSSFCSSEVNAAKKRRVESGGQPSRGLIMGIEGSRRELVGNHEPAPRAPAHHAQFVEGGRPLRSLPFGNAQHVPGNGSRILHHAGRANGDSQFSRDSGRGGLSPFRRGRGGRSDKDDPFSMEALKAMVQALVAEDNTKRKDNRALRGLPAREKGYASDEGANVDSKGDEQLDEKENEMEKDRSEPKSAAEREIAPAQERNNWPPVALDVDDSGEGRVVPHEQWLSAEPCELDDRCTQMVFDVVRNLPPFSTVANTNYPPSGPGTSAEVDQPAPSAPPPVVPVRFHFPSMLTPQKLVVTAVVHAYLCGKHAVLESPTGTGKTAALLNAVLAAQRDLATRFGRAPQIVYGTRTHGQVKQIVQELQASPYRPHVVCLGSREKGYCANEEVMQKFGDKMTLCNEARQNFRNPPPDDGDRQKLLKCGLFDAMEDPEIVEGVHQAVHAPPSLESEHKTDGHYLRDVEDLADVVKSHHGCPYFMSQALVPDANIVVCPYNYVLDPKIRAAVKLGTGGRFILLDEGHNIESVCIAGGSTKIDADKLQDDMALLRTKLPFFFLERPGATAQIHRVCAFFEQIVHVMSEWRCRMLQNAEQALAATKDAGKFRGFNETPFRNVVRYWCWAEAKYGDELLKFAGGGSGSLEPKGITEGLQELNLLREGGAHDSREMEVDPADAGAAAFEGFNATTGAAPPTKNRNRTLLRPESIYEEICREDNGLLTKIRKECDHDRKRKALGIYGQKRGLKWEHPSMCMRILQALAEVARVLKLLVDNPKDYVLHFDPAVKPEWTPTYNRNAGGGGGAGALGTAGSKMELSVMLQRPAVTFKEVAQEAHAIVLASGTLCPIEGLFAELGEDFSNRQLVKTHELVERNVTGFGGFVTAEKRTKSVISPLDASHVIRPSQLLVQKIAETVDGKKFSSTRADMRIWHERSRRLEWHESKLFALGWSIAKLAQAVPGGFLVFFPTYEMMKKCHTLWADREAEQETDGATPDARAHVAQLQRLQQNQDPLHSAKASNYGFGADKSVLQVLHSLKGLVLLEEKQRDIKEMKKEYMEYVDAHGQALLLGVMRGKCSEGISFKNDYARGVVVIGVCLPSLGEPNIVHKRAYNDHMWKVIGTKMRLDAAGGSSSGAAAVTRTQFFSGALASNSGPGVAAFSQFTGGQTFGPGGAGGAVSQFGGRPPAAGQFSSTNSFAGFASRPQTAGFQSQFSSGFGTTSQSSNAGSFVPQFSGGFAKFSEICAPRPAEQVGHGATPGGFVPAPTTASFAPRMGISASAANLTPGGAGEASSFSSSAAPFNSSSTTTRPATPAPSPKAVSHIECKHNFVNGNAWYDQQALRAINQALAKARKVAF